MPRLTHGVRKSNTLVRHSFVYVVLFARFIVRRLAPFTQEIGMNRKEFVQSALAQVEHGFPELYKSKVNRRLATLLRQYAPDKRVRKKTVGKVPMDFRILWALSGLLAKSAPEITENTSHFDLTRSLCMNEASVTLQALFWACVSEHFWQKGVSREDGFRLARDWSVSLMRQGDGSDSDGEKDIYGFLTLLLEGAGLIHLHTYEDA